MAKIIRLTESDLNKIVRRVLREQAQDQAGQELPGEDAYQKSVQAQKEMDDNIINRFMGKVSVAGDGGKTYYYRINDVKMPKIDESRTIRLIGKQVKAAGGRNYTDFKIGSNDPYFIVNYKCKWFQQPEGENKSLPQLDYKGRIEFLNEKAMSDSSNNAFINKDSVNFIDNLIPLSCIWNENDKNFNTFVATLPND
jgi:hypothetical protein